MEDSGEVAPVEAEIRALSTGLQGVKDEQEYIVVRERVHRDSESESSLRVLKPWGIRKTRARVEADGMMLVLVVTTSCFDIAAESTVSRSSPNVLITLHELTLVYLRKPASCRTTG